MIRYSVQPRDRIFVKGYGFFSFATNMIKNIGNNISKNSIGKYSQQILNHAKKSATNVLKTTSKRVIQKTAETIGDLIGNKIAVRITKVSKNLEQNNSESVTNEHDKEIFKERYICRDERQKIIDYLRLV